MSSLSQREFTQRRLTGTAGWLGRKKWVGLVQSESAVHCVNFRSGSRPSRGSLRRTSIQWKKKRPPHRNFHIKTLDNKVRRPCPLASKHPAPPPTVSAMVSPSISANLTRPPEKMELLFFLIPLQCDRGRVGGRRGAGEGSDCDVSVLDS